MIHGSNLLRSTGENKAVVQLSPRTEATHEIQASFSAILQEVGKQGYLSATDEMESELADESQVSVQQQAIESWADWFAGFGRSGYSDYIGVKESTRGEGTLTADDLSQGFGKIISDAYQQGGYADAKSFLKTLSKESMRTIQMVQRLADPIDVQSLSDEGALNLLIPPPAHVDDNRDGISQVGRANMLRFPDSNTPLAVRDAWEISTADLSPQDRMLYQFQVVSQISLSNLHLDDKGQFVRAVEPGDPDWVNPFADPDFSYQDVANGWIEYLDYFKNQIPPERYAKGKAFWNRFLAELG